MQKDQLMSKTAEKKIKVTQTGSIIRQREYHRQNLRGLGLGKIGRTRILENTPAVRGMIQKVHHLVSFEEI